MDETGLGDLLDVSIRITTNMKILIMTDMGGGVPTILACGEEALCREAEALTPGVITVSGKRGLLPDGLDHRDTESYRKAKLSALHKSPQRVRTLIQDAAAAAIRKLVSTPGAFGYPRLVAPFERTVRFRKSATVGPYETVDTHPDSITALMNMPIAPGPPLAGPAQT
jgi:D-aminopeptidase